MRLVLLFSFAIPIHLMMHKSLSHNRAGRVNLHRAACGFCVFGLLWFWLCFGCVLGFCLVVFCFSLGT